MLDRYSNAGSGNPDFCAGPAIPATGFRLSGGRMARRGRHGKSRPRHPSGQPVRLDGATDYGTIYSAVQKLRLANSDIAERAFAAVQASHEMFRQHLPGERWSEGNLDRQQQYAEMMHRAVSGAKKLVNVCFALGVAYERGWITEAEFNAGEELALLHRLVWGRLRGDIKIGLAKNTAPTPSVCCCRPGASPRRSRPPAAFAAWWPAMSATRAAGKTSPRKIIGDHASASGTDMNAPARRCGVIRRRQPSSSASSSWMSRRTSVTKDAKRHCGAGSRRSPYTLAMKR